MPLGVVKSWQIRNPHTFLTLIDIKWVFSTWIILLFPHVWSWVDLRSISTMRQTFTFPAILVPRTDTRARIVEQINTNEIVCSDLRRASKSGSTFRWKYICLQLTCHSDELRTSSCPLIKMCLLWNNLRYWKKTSESEV